MFNIRQQHFGEGAANYSALWREVSHNASNIKELDKGQKLHQYENKVPNNTDLIGLVVAANQQSEGGESFDLPWTGNDDDLRNELDALFEEKKAEEDEAEGEVFEELVRNSMHASVMWQNRYNPYTPNISVGYNPDAPFVVNEQVTSEITADMQGDKPENDPFYKPKLGRPDNLT